MQMQSDRKQFAVVFAKKHRANFAICPSMQPNVLKKNLFIHVLSDLKQEHHCLTI
jgi:hypothetical protein